MAEFTFEYRFPLTYFLMFTLMVILGVLVKDPSLFEKPTAVVVVGGALLIGFGPSLWQHFQGRFKIRARFLPDGVEIFDGSTTKMYGLKELKGFRAFGKGGRQTTTIAAAHVYILYVANSNEQIRLAFFPGFTNWRQVGSWLAKNLAYINSDGTVMVLNESQKDVGLQRQIMNQTAGWLIVAMIFNLLGWILTALYFRPVRPYETLLLAFIVNSPLTYLVYGIFHRRVIKTFQALRMERWRIFFIQTVVFFGVPMGAYDVEMYLNRSRDSGEAVTYSEAVVSKKISQGKHGPFYKVFYTTPIAGRLNIPGDGTKELSVRARDYDSVQPWISKVQLAVKPGRLGIPWIAGARLE